MNEGAPDILFLHITCPFLSASVSYFSNSFQQGRMTHITIVFTVRQQRLLIPHQIYITLYPIIFYINLPKIVTFKVRLFQ